MSLSLPDLKRKAHKNAWQRSEGEVLEEEATGGCGLDLPGSSRSARRGERVILSEGAAGLW